MFFLLLFVVLGVYRISRSYCWCALLWRQQQQMVKVSFSFQLCLKAIWGCYCPRKQLKLWMHHIPFHAFSGRQISLNAFITSPSILSQAHKALWVHEIPSVSSQTDNSSESLSETHQIPLNLFSGTTEQNSLKCIKSLFIFLQVDKALNASDPLHLFLGQRERNPPLLNVANPLHCFSGISCVVFFHLEFLQEFLGFLVDLIYEGARSSSLAEREIGCTYWMFFKFLQFTFFCNLIWHTYCVLAGFRIRVFGMQSCYSWAFTLDQRLLFLFAACLFWGDLISDLHLLCMQVGSCWRSTISTCCSCSHSCGYHDSSSGKIETVWK